MQAYVIGFVVAAVRRKRSFLEKAVGDRDAEDDPLLNLWDIVFLGGDDSTLDLQDISQYDDISKIYKTFLD